MYFDSLQAMVTMDGHGGFVWAAYIITITVVIGILLAPVRRRRHIIRQLQGELKREPVSQSPVEEGA